MQKIPILLRLSTYQYCSQSVRGQDILEFQFCAQSLKMREAKAQIFLERVLNFLFILKKKLVFSLPEISEWS